MLEMPVNEALDVDHHSVLDIETLDSWILL